MRTIMVLNAKGGCGKSTIATNLASYFAVSGKSTVLVDFDPQQSSLEWLNARDPKRPEIQGIDGTAEQVRVSKKSDVVIFDVPAVTHGKELASFVKRVETIVMPVLPSPLDIRAAAKFVQELRALSKVERNEVKIALVANRVRENTVVYHKLSVFLKSLKIPFIASLRDTQNYIRAADRGLGIFEMAPSAVQMDLDQWGPLIKWVNSKRSLP
ncbi:MAG: AAA family ATPase [Gammaproteobacteria bacterium]|nr:AAA family ATPase [Gammaproteobacteria bacterium]MDH5800304.1 AAA family ATPase [Gammaproteobacteria bacterium]